MPYVLDPSQSQSQNLRAVTCDPYLLLSAASVRFCLVPCTTLFYSAIFFFPLSKSNQSTPSKTDPVMASPNTQSAKAESQPQPAAQNPQQREPTTFLSLPRELRQFILFIVYEDSIMKYKTYSDFLNYDRNYNEFSYDHYSGGVCLAIEKWLKDIKQMDKRLEGDVAYVKGQYEKAYMAMNGHHVQRFELWMVRRRYIPLK